MSEPILIAGARILCPFTGIDAVGDVLIDRGRIALVKLGAGISAPDARRIEASGMVLTPGFIDLHVHLREPGEEHKETIESGAAAALAGGFTTICAMPNTRPALDSRMAIETVLERASGVGVEVLPIGAVTVGRAGEVLAPHTSLVSAGAVALSDDGSPVSDAGMMLRALQYSAMLGVPVSSHCEDLILSAGGSMHEGAISTRLGIPGIPAAAEEVMVRRDIALAEASGGRLHVAHISTAGAVQAVREAKARGVAVTAEATPHHVVLTDEWVAGWPRFSDDAPLSAVLGEGAYNTSTKVNPPLRSWEHVRAVVAGVQDGTIDAFATDHAPHSVLEKDCEYGCAAFGISGLETAFGLLMQLVHNGQLSLERLIHLLTAGPAAAFSLSVRGIEEGAPARVALLDPGLEWTVDAERLLSKGKNTPLHGHRLTGAVVMTFAEERVFTLSERGEVAIDR